MVTLTLGGIVVFIAWLLSTALKAERAENIRTKRPNLEHIPLVVGFEASKAMSEVKYKKAKARYDVLKNL